VGRLQSESRNAALSTEEKTKKEKKKKKKENQHMGDEPE